MWQPPPDTPADVREALLREWELAKEGEALGHRFGALGHYVSQRMTPADLRVLLRDQYDRRDARDRADAIEGRHDADQ